MKSFINRNINVGIVLAAAGIILSDTLLDWLFEFLHALFELLEFTLDALVEHLFHTDRQDTQAITFYLLLLITSLVLYKLVRRLPNWSQALRADLDCIAARLKMQLEDNLRAVPAMRQMKWWLVLALGTGMLMLGFLS